ncbi:hypothetical protein JCM12141A_31250 [Mycolicibacterium hodleri]
MPTIGLPSKAIRENPDARMAERCTNPGTSLPANHLALRNPPAGVVTVSGPGLRTR